MTQTKKPRSSKKRDERSAGESVETRLADFFTVGWMLTVMMTCLCEVGAFALGVFLRYSEGGTNFELLRGMLLFAAVVLGLVTLILTAVVWRLRRVPPPTSVTLFAIVVAVVPMLTMIIQSLD
ncbi:MAG: hypothetical protein KF708_09870 [Pirellulales bacterium]|nr:hypothetical protein [Pirellulales bacterium]